MIKSILVTGLNRAKTLVTLSKAIPLQLSSINVTSENHSFTNPNLDYWKVNFCIIINSHYHPHFKMAYNSETKMRLLYP